MVQPRCTAVAYVLYSCCLSLVLLYLQPECCAAGGRGVLGCGIVQVVLCSPMAVTYTVAVWYSQSAVLFTA